MIIMDKKPTYEDLVIEVERLKVSIRNLTGERDRVYDALITIAIGKKDGE
jgi:hypothetical protein